METIVIDSLAGLPGAARRLLEIIRERGATVVALYGHMGAGKTTLIRELAAQLGVRDNVTSPTFALINQYADRDGNPVNHFDFYRIETLSEAYDMGYEEYFFGGDLCLVEWPEKIEELLPEDALRVTIETSPDDRDYRKIQVL
jgi:tRNA threonylcarbamoyladenosine biosynthesis protein TsaE